MKWVFILIAGFSWGVFADDNDMQQKPSQPGKKVLIQSFDRSISAKDFGENYEDRKPGKDLPYPSSLPEKTRRDQALKASGVLEVPKYAQADELDRDILFLKAKKKSVADLRKIYPDLSLAVLKKLKKEVLK